MKFVGFLLCKYNCGFFFCFKVFWSFSENLYLSLTLLQIGQAEKESVYRDGRQSNFSLSLSKVGFLLLSK